MFSDCLGPLATVIGIDVNENCKQFESEYMHVRIWDHGDANFLESVLNEFGQPDVLLDDGSYMMQDVKNSFEYL